MAKSKLTDYTKISPNRTSPRTMKVDRITPHCYVGQASVESMAGWLCSPAAQASANYGIGADGRVACLVDEADRSWCSSSGANDHRAITIECASDSYDPYKINDKVYDKLIDLMVDICQRYGKKKLLWLGDKNTTLNYTPRSDEMVLTVHRWFANKACPGDYIYNRLGKIADTVTKRLSGSSDSAPAEKAEYTPSEWIAMIAPIAQDLARKYSVLPSVVIAQTALETGWGLTDLTRKYNIVGVKADLINSTWKEHSTWDGATYRKVTPEYHNGKLIHKEDDFRVYHSFRECLEDYVNFLLYVRNDKGYKYRRLQGLSDPKTVINIIKTGTGTNTDPEGYCTDPNYETKILNLIKEYKLTRYDEAMPDYVNPNAGPPEPVYSAYRVWVGSYKAKKNSDLRQKKLETVADMDTFVEKDGKYHVYCGSFSTEENAKARVEELNARGIRKAEIRPVT